MGSGSSPNGSSTQVVTCKKQAHTAVVHHLGTHCGEEVVGLRRYGVRRWLGQRRILFERLVILLNFPPSEIEGRYLLVRECQVA